MLNPLQLLYQLNNSSVWLH